MAARFSVAVVVVVVLLLLLVLTTTTTLACHPLCTYQCDDPVCLADCHPVCRAPNCSLTCTNPTDVSHCSSPNCNVECPAADQCESDECPACSTLCAPVHCLTRSANCTIQCTETVCGWECVKPTDCPLPTCQLQCDQPACQPPSLGTVNAPSALAVAIIVFVGIFALTNE